MLKISAKGVRSTVDYPQTRWTNITFLVPLFLMEIPCVKKTSDFDWNESKTSMEYKTCIVVTETFLNYCKKHKCKVQLYTLGDLTPLG